MPGIARRRVRELDIISDCEIAVVFDVKAQSDEQGQKTGRSERRRPHQGPALGGSDIDGCAEQRDLSGWIRFESADHNESSRAAKYCPNIWEKTEQSLELRRGRFPLPSRLVYRAIHGLEGTKISVRHFCRRPSPAVPRRRLSRIAKGRKARCSYRAHARIAKGGGLVSSGHIEHATLVGTQAAVPGLSTPLKFSK